MKKLMMFVLVAFCATLAAKHATASEKENFMGTWEYQVPSAPYEYSKGKLIITEVEGKTQLTVKFTNGKAIKAQDVKIENENISFQVEVEYDFVKCNCKIVDGKITGKVDSADGIMQMTADKSK